MSIIDKIFGREEVTFNSFSFFISSNLSLTIKHPNNIALKKVHYNVISSINKSNNNYLVSHITFNDSKKEWYVELYDTSNDSSLTFSSSVLIDIFEDISLYLKKIV